jgi:hypothetical protein
VTDDGFCVLKTSALRGLEPGTVLRVKRARAANALRPAVDPDRLNRKLISEPADEGVGEAKARPGGW